MALALALALVPAPAPALSSVLTQGLAPVLALVPGWALARALLRILLSRRRRATSGTRKVSSPLRCLQQLRSECLACEPIQAR